VVALEEVVRRDLGEVTMMEVGCALEVPRGVLLAALADRGYFCGMRPRCLLCLGWRCVATSDRDVVVRESVVDRKRLTKDELPSPEDEDGPSGSPP
jgi:hypothetical protein